jgi:single-stranded DNA-binding protein
MKQIVIAGNIGKDAELRSTQSGDQVAGFSVGVEKSC